MRLILCQRTHLKIQQIQRILLIPAIQQTQEILIMKLIQQTARISHLRIPRIRHQVLMSPTAISQNIGRICGLT